MITKKGNIGYKKNGGLWIQSSPIACEACEKEVSRKNLGSISGEPRVPGAGLHEVVLCCECAEEPEPLSHGWAFWKFCERHPEF